MDFFSRLELTFLLWQRSWIILRVRTNRNKIFLFAFVHKKTKWSPLTFFDNELLPCVILGWKLKRLGTKKNVYNTKATLDPRFRSSISLWLQKRKTNQKATKQASKQNQQKFQYYKNCFLQIIGGGWWDKQICPFSTQDTAGGSTFQSEPGLLRKFEASLG